MKFIYKNIGDIISDNIKVTKEIIIASAFFYPSQIMREDLKKIDTVKIYISDDYRINNPYIIDELLNSRKIQIKEISFNDKGIFHAKVIIFKMNDDKYSVIIGSVNYTFGGFYSNDETVLLFENLKKNDALIQDLNKWIKYIDERSNKINIINAKKYFDKNNIKFDIKKQKLKNKQKVNTIQYWVIKPGHKEFSKWYNFKNENVVSIGWSLLKFEDLDINNINNIVFLNRIKNAYINKSEKQYNYIFKTFMHFYNDIKIGDYVIIMQGYASNQKSDVSIYGIGKIISKPFYEKESSWWYSKIKIKLQSIEEKISVENIKKVMMKNSMRLTIHKIKEKQFLTLINELQNNFSVNINIK